MIDEKHRRDNMKIEKKIWIFAILWALFCFITLILTLPAKQTKNLAEPVEKEYNDWQPPEKIMDAMGLKTGMVIGEIGAGGGRFTFWFADRVGENGKVYANDIDLGALIHLKKRCKEHSFTNVITRVGKGTDPNIPPGVLDIAFMIGTYHHLDSPIELIHNLIPTLKPEGILVIVENDPEKSGWTSHTTPKDILIEQISQAGLELIRIETFLRRDNVYYFRPKI
jgi:SAM-dependent methyltransferase